MKTCTTLLIFSLITCEICHCLPCSSKLLNQFDLRAHTGCMDVCCLSLQLFFCFVVLWSFVTKPWLCVFPGDFLFFSGGFLDSLPEFSVFVELWTNTHLMSVLLPTVICIRVHDKQLTQVTYKKGSCKYPCWGKMQKPKSSWVQRKPTHSKQ